jgi:hypothetical protein
MPIEHREPIAVRLHISLTQENSSTQPQDLLFSLSDSDQILLGRAPANDVKLDASSVSGVHACICRLGDDFFLEDQGSRNGTFLNTRRLMEGEKIRLTSGDLIRIGVYDIWFFCGEGCNQPLADNLPDSNTACINDEMLRCILGGVMEPERWVDSFVYHELRSKDRPSEPAVPVIDASEMGMSVEEILKQFAPDSPDERVVKTLRRKGVVRYYTRMNLNRIFPLLVSIIEAALYIKIPDLPKVSQVESDKVMEIKETSPYVRLIPVLPGCIISPPECVVDVRSEKVDAEFRIAPQSEGDLREFARVEIWHEGQRKDSIPIPCVVRTQLLTKIASSCAVISSVSGAFLEAYVGNAPVASAPAGQSFAATIAKKFVVLLGSSGLWLGLFFLVAAFLCYLWLRPRRGDIIEKFLTTEIH